MNVWFLFLLLLIAVPLARPAEPCGATPASAPQGDVIRLACSQEVDSARMNGRTIRLFKQNDGKWLGLMPVAANDAPGTVAIEFLSSSQQAIASEKVTIRNAHFATQNVDLAPAVANLHNTPEEMAMLKAFRDSVTDERYWGDKFEEPVSGCVVSPFGVKRYRNHKPTGEYHGGVDLRASAGEPIHAADAGTVRIAQPITVLGGAVGLDHGQGVESIYMHMSKIAVQAGAHVNRGDVIGYAGSTGRSTAPHLHWTVYVNKVQVNPAQWVTLIPCTTDASGKPMDHRH